RSTYCLSGHGIFLSYPQLLALLDFVREVSGDNESHIRIFACYDHAQIPSFLGPVKEMHVGIFAACTDDFRLTQTAANQCLLPRESRMFEANAFAPAIAR